MSAARVKFPAKISSRSAPGHSPPLRARSMPRATAASRNIRSTPRPCGMIRAGQHRPQPGPQRPLWMRTATTLPEHHLRSTHLTVAQPECTESSRTRSKPMGPRSLAIYARPTRGTASAPPAGSGVQRGRGDDPRPSRRLAGSESPLTATDPTPNAVTAIPVPGYATVRSIPFTEHPEARPPSATPPKQRPHHRTARHAAAVS